MKAARDIMRNIKKYEAVDLRRDDRESNIGAAHQNCNFEKGSKRIA